MPNAADLDDLQKTAVDALWVLTPEQRKAVIGYFCLLCHGRKLDGHTCPKE